MSDVAPSITFDQDAYRVKSREIWEKVGSKPSLYEPTEWASSEGKGAETIVYGVFSFSSNGNSWKLFWDPLKVPADERVVKTTALPTILSTR